MPILFLALALSVLRQSHCAAVEPNDVLNGKGLFLTPSTSHFTMDSLHTTSFITWNGSNVLRLEKPSSSAVTYKSGMSYTFPSSHPVHISFKFASTNPDTEDSNLRIMDSTEKTLLLFRAGKGGLIRVNQQQMISFYNASISTDSNIKLTQMDLIVNWTDKHIEIFVNHKYKQTCKFFDKDVGEVSKLLIYNLYNSVSYWQDIVVCKEICYDFKFEQKISITIFVSLILLMLMNLQGG